MTNEIFLKNGGIPCINILLLSLDEVGQVKTYSNSFDNNVIVSNDFKEIVLI